MDFGERQPRVFSIHPAVSFLDCLADSLLDGTLIDGHDFANNPYLISRLQILVPTRRAGLALRKILLDRMGPDAAILPEISPLADIDDADLAFEDATSLSPWQQDQLSAPLPPVIPATTRRLLLAKLVLQWTNQMADGQQFTAASSPAQALKLASDLAALIDSAVLEGCEWAKLDQILPEDLSDYWSSSLDFIQIAVTHWPNILNELQVMDAADHGSQVLRRAGERLRVHGSRRPILAAGSTGSVAATADLLSIISRLPNGAVVLPGLDYSLSDQDWRAVHGDSVGDEATFAGDPGHPQYALSALLKKINIGRSDVRLLGAMSSRLESRQKIVSHAMIPAVQSHQWFSLAGAITPLEQKEAFDGVTLVQARNETEEALTIAVALREACLDSSSKCALVTPDRGLARRVMIELKRWDIDVDDSAGISLSESPAGRLLRHLVRFNPHQVEALTLLSILKHPHCRLGRSAEQARRTARLIERALFRGFPIAGSLGDLLSFLREQRQLLFNELRYPLAAQAGLSDADWAACQTYLSDLVDAFEDLTAHCERGQQTSLESCADALIKTIDRLSLDEVGQSHGWIGDDGEAVARFLAGLSEELPLDFSLSFHERADFFESLMSGQMVRSSRPSPHQISIWGALEARLQHVDFIILAGLNETSWPAQPKLDAFLSRPMRAAIGLSSPERFIGLAGHDFVQGTAKARVLLSRSQRSGGSPTTASRWLQRLNAFLDGTVWDEMNARGARLIRLARQLDHVPSSHVKPISRPSPTPALTLRPRKLSVTEIETLIRDPYAIYAKHILRLKPFDPIAPEPGASDRGSLIHSVLHDFTSQFPDKLDDKQSALQALLSIAYRHFQALEAFPVEHTLWWHRLERIADWFIDQRLDEDAAGYRQRISEESGRLLLTLPSGSFELTARADRIDVSDEHGITIIDYKTGSVPTRSMVEKLFSPQLPLEALILVEGGFGDGFGDRVTSLDYIKLSGGDPPGDLISVVRDDAVIELADAAKERLLRLATLYENQDYGYESRPRVLWEKVSYSAYDDLARVAEWSAQGGEE